MRVLRVRMPPLSSVQPVGLRVSCSRLRHLRGTCKSPHWPWDGMWGRLRHSRYCILFSGAEVHYACNVYCILVFDALLCMPLTLQLAKHQKNEVQCQHFEHCWAKKLPESFAHTTYHWRSVMHRRSHHTHFGSIHFSPMTQQKLNFIDIASPHAPQDPALSCQSQGLSSIPHGTCCAKSQKLSPQTTRQFAHQAKT